MQGIFAIIAGGNLYLFVFILGRSEFGDGRPILVALYFVLAILWMLEFAIHVGSMFKQRKASRSEKLKERLRKDDTTRRKTTRT